MGLSLGDFLGEVAQPVQLGADGLGGRQLSISVAFLGHALAPDLGSPQAGVEAGRVELGISLALAIDNGGNIGEEVGQMDFSSSSYARRGEVYARITVANLLIIVLGTRLQGVV